jgi:hypothetical protein
MIESVRARPVETVDAIPLVENEQHTRSTRRMFDQRSD